MTKITAGSTLGAGFDDPEDEDDGHGVAEADEELLGLGQEGFADVAVQVVAGYAVERDAEEHHHGQDDQLDDVQALGHQLVPEIVAA